jgi:hypothetical protein
MITGFGSNMNSWIRTTVPGRVEVVVVVVVDVVVVALVVVEVVVREVVVVGAVVVVDEEVVVVSCVTQPHNRINAKMRGIIVFIVEYCSSRI